MPAPSAADPHVERLARLFREHPSWLRAARRLDASVTSTVYFGHRPGEPWHLERCGKTTELRPGAASDPDFVFCFPPAAIERLESQVGEVGDFAVELFRLVVSEDPQEQIGLRIRAPFARLVRRGYLGLLASGGPRVLAFGAAHGVRTLSALKRLVEESRTNEPAAWELPVKPESAPRSN